MIDHLRPVVAALVYCLLASTTIRLVKSLACVALALGVLLLGPHEAHANPGEFTVATCQADDNTYSVSAFTHFAHRGMLIRYACAPTGPGLRGVVTQNVVRKGRVKRGSEAKVSIEAPAGTRMTSFRWAGAMRRRDCRYALQLWADAPGGAPIPIAQVKANRACPRPRRAQASQFREQWYAIPGATRVTQRVVCVGKKKQDWCSAREPNYVKTERASVVFADAQPPSVEILQDTPLTQGQWASGTQTINYTASDNIGVRQARALLNGQEAALHSRDCLLLAPTGPFTAPQPCPNGPGQLVVRTEERRAEGTQQLVVDAEDPAGNRAASSPVTVRIDRTAPPRVEVSVEGGSDWRSDSNLVASWVNPDEGDRAPITAVTYELCSARSTPCSRGIQAAAGIAHLPLTVPAAGQWTLSIWRRDAAGNENREHASVPVTLRYDPDPPQLAFVPPEPTDPTLVAVRVTDELSGFADGIIEIVPSGSSEWHSLPTQKDGNRLVARIDDVALAPGAYLLRARALDRAGNETMIDRRGDGQPMVITLPLRRPPTLEAGFERIVRTKRGGQVVVLHQATRVGFGARVSIAGRLVGGDGVPIASGVIQLRSSTVTDLEQPVETLTTDADGRFRAEVSGIHTRRLRLVYAGSLQALPSEHMLDMRVPASTSVRPSRRRLRNGQAVSFTGRVLALPVPADGKLVEIQVRFTDRWQTFRTTRSDALGRWSSRYRFQRTRGIQNYRFRVRLPKEAGYPFETGVSRTLVVQVSGR